MRTDISVAGLVAAEAMLEIGLCFHHAVAGNDDAFTIALRRLRDLTEDGDYAYYVDIAHFMAGLPISAGVSAGRSGSTPPAGPTRDRCRNFVMSRRRYLSSAR